MFGLESKGTFFTSYIGHRTSSLRIQSVQRARERNRLPHVLQSANPRYRALDAHAESG